jgi:hypothetical protein
MTSASAAMPTTATTMARPITAPGRAQRRRQKAASEPGSRMRAGAAIPAAPVTGVPVLMPGAA